MEPEAIHDLTPAYALDALDSHESVEFEEHLTDAHAKKLFAKIDAKKASRYERTPPDDLPTTPTAPP